MIKPHLCVGILNDKQYHYVGSLYRLNVNVWLFPVSVGVNEKLIFFVSLFSMYNSDWK